MAAAKGYRTLVWLRPEQADLVAHVAEAAGLGVIASGSAIHGDAAVIGERFSTPPQTDLRTLLASCDAEVVFLASLDAERRSPPGGGSGAGDTSALREAMRGCMRRGCRVFTLEPIPASVLEVHEPALVSKGEAQSGAAEAFPRFVPLARWSRSFVEAGGVFEQFGASRTVSIECWGAPPDGSLAARLFDGMDLVHTLLGRPDVIEAAFVGADHAVGLHSIPGETLEGIHGDISANLRFADGRAASIVASDRAGRWRRGLTVLGAGGRLRIADDGFEWIDASGVTIEETRRRAVARGVRTTLPTCPALIAEQILRVLDGRAASDGATDFTQVLSMCQAALLSARTGEGESPATLLRMAGAM